ncbi:MAG TPA: outer membrane beta-barrel protein, partial [Chitinophagaceae bacterium]|nr:outer membrane beta-barrel protein [Chitinophagaceae bacterium]
DGAYSNYIIDNVAVGGRLGFLNMVQKSDDNTFRYNWTNFNFEPEVTLNAPVSNGFRNTFIRVGGILGAQKIEFKSPGTTNTDKYTTTGFQLGGGYNTFFTDQSAIQLYGGYRSYVEKEKETDNKTKVRGPFISIGVIHSFK